MVKVSTDFKQSFKQLKHHHGLKKYQHLLVLIICFLVLTVSMLLVSAYTTRKAAIDAQSVDVAARQGRLLQQMSKNMIDLELYITKNLGRSKNISTQNLSPEILAKIKETQELETAFNDVVRAFDKSGTIMLAGNTQVEVAELKSDESKQVIQKVYGVWNPYKASMDHLFGDISRGQFTLDSVEKVVAYGRQHTQGLMMDTIQMNIQLKAELAKKARMWNILQFLGILVSFVLFALIVFGALRQLLANDEQLDMARQQTAEILDTVHEGLFLINKDFVIFDEYSKSVETILNQKNLRGKTLTSVLDGTVSYQDLENVKLFIEQLYNPWVVEELIQDLNPLQEVKINQLLSDGTVQVKYLDFKFLRVNKPDSEEIEKVFVNVVDITNAVQLQKKLDKMNMQHDRELEMISVILTVNQQHLLSFIDNVQQRAFRMNDILKMSTMTNALDLHSKARQLFREAHSLKGEASALQLHAFVNSIDKLEGQLTELLEKPQLSGHDFLPFTVSLDELLDLNRFISKLLERLRQMSSNNDTSNSLLAMSEATVEAKMSWKDYFAKYAQDIAQRQAKKVNLVCEGFDDFASHAHFETYKDIAMQLLKNAIVHGIETPAQRVQQGKSEVGTIKLTLAKNAEGEIILNIVDDGQGINVERIRAKAVQLGFVTAEQAPQLSDKALYEFMFKSGFSTAETQDEDAGRGVGMDIVQKLITSVQGRLGMKSVPKQSTQFMIKFLAK